jgi:hypothetical protein
MYYRVAIKIDPSPTWQWRSTILSSLDALFQFLRPYRALPHDRLRVFTSSSREDMNEQLVQANNGRESNSVTAEEYLQEQMIGSREVVGSVSAGGTPEQQGTASIAVGTRLLSNESSGEIYALDGMGMCSLERRRVELERGAGGDHDIPYTFTLPPCMPQVLAWVRLLARIDELFEGLR